MKESHRLAHIINPVVTDQSSNLFIAQPITFESMRVARDFAKSTVDVSLFTAQFEDDHNIIPDYFIHTLDLTRSILDVGDFKVKRKLPLIRDILDRLYSASDAEYSIYTNVDIALMPNFYTSVNSIIGSGIDSFIINRRTLSAQYKSVRDLPLMYADIGLSHIGYDCFIFKRECIPRFLLGNICIGVPRIGTTMAANLICFSNKFREFADVHLTFHIGNDRRWQDKALRDYVFHNQAEAEIILNKLAPRFDMYNLPSVGMPALVKYFNWLKNKTGQSEQFTWFD
jgi:hypothetical protein